MITDRVIALIETHANMAGVEKAKAGFGGLNLSTLALGAALGGLILVGKDAIKNTEAMDKAHLSLSQATKASRQNFSALQTAFDAWAEANKRYIPDQYAAETALAAFVRAGNTAKDSMRMLNDALDLSTLKGIDMATAQSQVEKAVMGSVKALKDLGISTATVTAIMHSHLTTEQKHLAILRLIEAKTKDGRKAQTELTQSTQALNKDWQDITTKVGPPLLGLFSFVVGKADQLVKALNDLGQNKQWNKVISQGLGTIQREIVTVVQGFEQLLGWISRLSGSKVNVAVGSNRLGATPGRAAGGSVAAGGAYTVGERGPETLVMGSQGGSIIPHGGGASQLHIHIDRGAFIDGPSIDRLANLILQRARYAPGR